ncbi:hypothetical protein BGX38DRAFT_1262412 [Terfezia claveryi]|nr:hypothetical protein BGX38DRAFT_1262412 [Terfezia claveryi]
MDSYNPGPAFTPTLCIILSIYPILGSVLEHSHRSAIKDAQDLLLLLEDPPCVHRATAEMIVWWKRGNSMVMKPLCDHCGSARKAAVAIAELQRQRLRDNGQIASCAQCREDPREPEEVAIGDV